MRTLARVRMKDRRLKTRQNRTLILINGIISVFLATTACQRNVGTGTVVGAGTGVFVGGVAGGWQGALIGGAAGAVTGAFVGYVLDENDKRKLTEEQRKRYETEQKHQYSIDDLVRMKKNGLSDNATMAVVKTSKSCYRHTDVDAQKLSNAGFSDQFIENLPVCK